MNSLRLHVEDIRAKPDVFRMTRARVAAARRRNPVASRGCEISHGEDLERVGRWLPGIEALVCSSDVLMHPRFPLRTLADAAPRLRWIHVIGAGVERLLPLDWVPRGLVLTNNSGVHARKMYEYALMAFTLLNARLPAMIANQSARRWAATFTPTCEGRTALVLGTGDIGGAFGRAARHLGMHSIGVNRSGRRAADFDETRRVSALAAAAKRADFLVVATPLTDETRGLASRRVLAALKPGAAVVNVGRGAVLDTAALVAALRTGRLSGALLDVFDPEPLPPASPLWRVPNLLVSPHCSSDDAEQYIPLTLDLVMDNARRLATRKPLRNAVDPRRQY